MYTESSNLILHHVLPEPPLRVALQLHATVRRATKQVAREAQILVENRPIECRNRHLRYCPVKMDSGVSNIPRFLASTVERTCNGTAISAATKPNDPRKQLFKATADELRPTLASTIYARVLEYMDLQCFAVRRALHR